jgi:hypothetical protein
MNEEKKVSPAVVGGLIAIAVLALGFLGWSIMNKPSGGDAAAIAGVAKEIQAPANTPTIPPSVVQAEVINRGSAPGGGGGGMMGGGVSKNRGR